MVVILRGTVKKPLTRLCQFRTPPSVVGTATE
jgi:hypothetical protein